MERSPGEIKDMHEVVDTKLILEFMRHGKKENAPEKHDDEVRLLPQGKAQATSKGKELGVNIKAAVGRRSPKKRTGETVLHAMLANETGVDPDANLEDLEMVTGAALNSGKNINLKKLSVDKRLGFELGGVIGQEMLAAYKAGKLLPYVVEHSDERVLAEGEGGTTTYSMFAANVADIIRGYLSAANNFNRLALKNKADENFGRQIERYLGTHQGVVENFVAKVLEKKYGVAKRDEFVKSVGGGFKETEGIHVEVNNHGEEQSVAMTFNMNGQKEIVSLTKELLDIIIAEGDNFEKALKEAQVKKGVL